MKRTSDNKLEIAADMIRIAMSKIGSDTQVILLCDSWYPKGAVIETVKSYANLHMITAVRVDTSIYNLPEEVDCKGQVIPKLWGDKFDYKSFKYRKIERSKNQVACKRVLTKLFGADVPVYRMITKYDKSGTYRMYISTLVPQDIRVNHESNPLK